MIDYKDLFLDYYAKTKIKNNLIVTYCFCQCLNQNTNILYLYYCAENTHCTLGIFHSIIVNIIFKPLNTEFIYSTKNI